MFFRPVIVGLEYKCHTHDLNICLLKIRVENLKKFKSDDADCPTLVCTDLAARGLDLDVDHVIMFDFPSNSVGVTIF